MQLDWKKAVEYGGITGVCILYVCLVGMVEAFNDRDVIDGILTLGQSLLVVIGLGMGYAIARRISDHKIGPALAGSLIVGLIGGLMTAIFVALIEPLNMRNMFVNASPALIEILTFSQESMAVGLAMFIAFMILLCLVGTGIYLLPHLLRRFIIAGISAVLLIGMLEELLSVIMDRFEIGKDVADFLFGRNGLSIMGTVVIFLLFGSLHVLWVSQGRRVKSNVAYLPDSQQRVIRWILTAAAILLLLALPQLVGSYISQILVLVGLFTLMGLGLNIEIGLAGLLDLGFVGFYAIGAYTVAILTSPTEVGLGYITTGEAVPYMSFWGAVPIAVAAAALSGIFLGIPVLRMRGDYLAIVTLGLAEIIRILVLSDFLRPVLGGAQGILSIPKPAVVYLAGIFGSLPLQIKNVIFIFFTETGQIKDPGHFYYLIIIGCTIIGFIAWRLQHARIGRSWMALREDEDVAEAMGINLITAKLLAFGIGASFAGLAGAIFATQVGSIFPHSFQLLVSINVVSLVIIGGVGSIPGVILGALVLVGLPELLREFAEFRLLIYGALLVVMMLVKPEGLWPSDVVRRELHAGEDNAPLPAGQTA